MDHRLTAKAQSLITWFSRWWRLGWWGRCSTSKSAWTQWLYSDYEWQRCHTGTFKQDCEGEMLKQCCATFGIGIDRKHVWPLQHCIILHWLCNLYLMHLRRAFSVASLHKVVKGQLVSASLHPCCNGSVLPILSIAQHWRSSISISISAFCVTHKWS